MLESFEKSFQVCSCRKVELETIVKAIINNNLKTLGQIQEFTTAGTDCRNCVLEEADFGKLKKKIYLKDILKEVLNG